MEVSVTTSGTADALGVLRLNAKRPLAPCDPAWMVARMVSASFSS